MKSAGPGIFSLQAVLISLALHAVVVGGLFSLGRSDRQPPAETQPPVEQAKGGEASPPPAGEMEKQPADEPRKAGDGKPPREEPVEKPKPEEERPKPETEKPKPEKKTEPVEIRIEPRETVKAEKKAEKEKVGDETSPKPKSGATRVYVVKRGDTLTALARDCGLTVSELAELNGKSVKRLSNLWVGQKIKLPAED